MDKKAPAKEVKDKESEKEEAITSAETEETPTVIILFQNNCMAITKTKHH